MKTSMAMALLAMLVVSSGASAGPADADTARTAELKKSLEARFPGAKIQSMRLSPELPGMYELVTDREIAYVDGSGNYLVTGHLMDTRTQADLTAQRWDELHVIDFASLPLDHAIKRVHGDGSRKLALFADPDCPYCQQLEHELQDIDNVTIYTFLFPLKNLHPDAYSKAVKIWCSANPDQTWTRWMLTRGPLEAASCQQDVIEQNIALGHKLGVDATPTLFLTSGRRIGGAVSRAELEAKLTAQ